MNKSQSHLLAILGRVHDYMEILSNSLPLLLLVLAKMERIIFFIVVCYLFYTKKTNPLSLKYQQFEWKIDSILFTM